MSSHSPIPRPRQMILNALKEGGTRLHDLVLQDFERVFYVAFRYYQETRQLPYNQPLKIRVVHNDAKKVG